MDAVSDLLAAASGCGAAFCYWGWRGAAGPTPPAR
jgi:hypothetical protein